MISDRVRRPREGDAHQGGGGPGSSQTQGRGGRGRR